MYESRDAANKLRKAMKKIPKTRFSHITSISESGIHIFRRILFIRGSGACLASSSPSSLSSTYRVLQCFARSRVQCIIRQYIIFVCVYGRACVIRKRPAAAILPMCSRLCSHRECTEMNKSNGNARSRYAFSGLTIARTSLRVFVCDRRARAFGVVFARRRRRRPLVLAPALRCTRGVSSLLAFVSHNFLLM